MSAERITELPKELTTSLENYSLGYLKSGRKEWDEPHTRSVVHYAGEIARAEGLDVLVLTTVAWLHDIGYYNQFEADSSKEYDQVMDKKALHMINGARLAGEFLAKEDIKGFYTEVQRERIVHLVSVHDKIEELIDPDEIAFMEADTLGAIDISRVTPTFDRKNAKKYIENDLLGRRFPKFKTRTGIAAFQYVFPKFVDYF